MAKGLLLHQVDPIYPRQAMQKKIQGRVFLIIVIDRGGNVTKATVAQGDPILARAAADAVKQWKYRPYTLDGKEVAVTAAVYVYFRL